MASASSPPSPTPDDDQVKTITARCYCGSIHYEVSLPAAQLPLSAYLCHCSGCRHTFGALCVAHANLPAGVRPRFVDPSSSLATAATRYQAPGSIYETYHCATCGSHAGGYCAATDVWIASTALFPPAADPPVFVLRAHYFTRSAPRGLHTWLPAVGARALDVINPDDRTGGGEGDGSDVDATRPRFCPYPLEGPSPPDAATAPAPLPRLHPGSPEAGTDDPERLLAECRCGGVSFTISRPAPSSRIGDGNRWRALADACNDCRLAGGVPVSAWACVARQALRPRVGEGDDGQPRPSSMRVFTSSPGGTARTFCGVCGASVLLCRGRGRAEGEDGRADTPAADDIVYVAVGILHALEGVTADRWLTWRTEEVGWLSAGSEYDAEFYRSLNRGYRAWGEREHGGTVDFKLPPPLGHD